MPSPRDALPGFDGLTPQRVLDALDAVSLRGDGRMLQLNSYENRVFQIYLEQGGAVVAKFYRPARWSDAQILEEHAFSRELEEAEVPVVAPLVLQPDPEPLAPVELLGAPATLAVFEAEGQRHRFAVAPRRPGRGPELLDPHTLAWIGRFIGRLHAVGRRRPFVHRRAIDVETFGHAPLRWLLANDIVPPEALPAWRDAAQRCLDAADTLFAHAPATVLRLHGDCHPGNILWTEQGPHFVDLDDAVTGPAVQDLWMLLSGEPDAMQRQLGHVLGGYRSFSEFDAAELALIEPLRTLRMIHHSVWLAQRWSDPAFPVAFPWFGEAAYWQQQTIQLREQLSAMAEPPLRA